MKKCILAVYAALIVFLLAVPASAGNCAHVSYGYQQSYQTYTPTYAYNGYVNVVAQAVPYYLPLQTFASVGDDARSYYTTKDAVKAGTLEALREFQASSQPVGPPPLAPQPGNGNLAAPAKQGPPVGNLAKVQAMANESCVRCHGKSANHGLDLTNVAALTESQLLKIQHRIMKAPDDPKAMPQGGGKSVAPEYIDATNARIDEVTRGPVPQIPPAK